MKREEIPPMEAEIEAGKLLFSSGHVPLITDRNPIYSACKAQVENERKAVW